MLAELRTRCGCTQRFYVAEPPKDRITLLLEDQSGFTLDPKLQEGEVRKFYFREVRHKEGELFPIAHYQEK